MRPLTDQTDKPKSDISYSLRTPRQGCWRLRHELVLGGFCAKNPTIRLCLAAEKSMAMQAGYKPTSRRKGGSFWVHKMSRQELKHLRDSGYENSVAAVVTKLLLRDGKPSAIEAE